MIYRTPQLKDDDLAALALVDEQRDRLHLVTQQSPHRWTGSLRRSFIAKAIQGSNSIEGINANLDEAVAAIQQEPPIDERTETWMALSGYQAAMTYIMQAARDPYFEFSKQFLKSLQFMIAGYHMDNQPGQWRSGSVFVVNQKTGETVYEPPEVDLVDSLVTELVDYLKEDRGEPALVRAALAHLNLTMIHPFKDGNGRVARALQTLVIAQDGIVHPVFSSIEEWLGDYTQEYYDILAFTGHGKWSPYRDALPWVRFCIKGHYQQAAKLIRRNEEAERLYQGIMGMIGGGRLPDRTWTALFDASLGFRITNSRYRNDAEITDYTAGRDLKRLCEAGLLEPKGDKRSRIYEAGKPLTSLRQSTRIKRPLEDPYQLVIRRRKPVVGQAERLPGL